MGEAAATQDDGAARRDEVLALRRMRRSELDLAVQWAAAEGWNPGVHDADAFAAADPDGFFVGAVDGEMVASISIVTYDASYAFLGFYIVRPDRRGSGYGLRLWQYALEQASARTIGLDGVVAQISTYERAGFILAYRSVRYLTRSGSSAAVTKWVRVVDAADLERLIAYDRLVFGAPRPGFVSAWLAQAGMRARLAEVDGVIVGWGAIRPAVVGYRVGPLFAESATIAEELLAELLASVPPGAVVAIDVPSPNPDAVNLVRRRRMLPEFETARMYRGPAPDLPTQYVYGVTSFELG